MLLQSHSATENTPVIHDVRIEVLIKPGCLWSFDFVDSIERLDGRVMIKTCVGVHMRVEIDCSVSEISETFDTVMLGAPGSSQNALFGTIIVPPSYCFHVGDIECVFET